MQAARTRDLIKGQRRITQKPTAVARAIKGVEDLADATNYPIVL